MHNAEIRKNNWRRSGGAFGIFQTNSPLLAQSQGRLNLEKTFGFPFTYYTNGRAFYSFFSAHILIHCGINLNDFPPGGET
jgi:hypothetical protein